VLSGSVLLLVSCLLVSATLAVWIGARVGRTGGVATRAFLCLCVAVAWWCAAGAGHAIAASVPAKLLWAKLQYPGIASAAPWWLLFTAEYAGVPLFARRASAPVPIAVRLLWVIPVITVALAATNEWHHAVWSSVVINTEGRAVYSYGPWFWVSAAYSYVLLAAGSFLIVRRAWRFPAPLRKQFTTVLFAAIVPWAANVLFLSGSVPPGLDVTPLAFAVSSLLFAWGLFRTALFDLVPVARDLVIDSLSDAMVVIDGARRILDMNAAAADLAGRKATIAANEAGWVGRDVATVFPLLTDVPLQTTALVATSKLLGSGDDPVWFDVRVLPVQWRGQASIAWVVLLRDVTEQRRASAEHNALEQRVQEQDRRESVSILAAGVAHEFNNLLTGIVGNADLLAMQVPASSNMGTSVGEILLSAQRAADLVSKMLAYAGEGHASIARVDLETLMRDSIDLLQTSSAGRFEVAYDGRRAVIDGDPSQIRQVAANLISNAADAVSEGGRLTIRTGVETLAASDLAQMRFGQDVPPGEYAFLDVRDDGVGMDEMTMRRLFKPFFTTKPIGHGLGLAAVQGIVLGHRGTMKVESRLGEGSRFCVWFPLARAGDGTATAAIMRFDRSIREDQLAAPGAGSRTWKESA
jgi:signal transduction histidine kinase